MPAARLRSQPHVYVVVFVNMTSASAAEDVINVVPSEASNWLKSTGDQSLRLPAGRSRVN